MHSAVINCAINPEIGHEYEHGMDFTPKVQKKVLIAGGGMGGWMDLENTMKGEEPKKWTPPIYNN